MSAAGSGLERGLGVEAKSPAKHRAPYRPVRGGEMRRLWGGQLWGDTVHAGMETKAMEITKKNY